METTGYRSSWARHVGIAHASREAHLIFEGSYGVEMSGTRRNTAGGGIFLSLCICVGFIPFLNLSVLLVYRLSRNDTHGSHGSSSWEESLCGVLPGWQIRFTGWCNLG